MEALFFVPVPDALKQDPIAIPPGQGVAAHAHAARTCVVIGREGVGNGVCNGFGNGARDALFYYISNRLRHSAGSVVVSGSSISCMM